MASQWTIPKIVTWRVKDWASCFLSTKLPLDVDEDNNGNTTNNNNLTFKRKSTKKKRSERKLSLSPPGTRHLHLRRCSVSPTTSTSEQRRLSWPQPPVSDEADFIVLNFDGKDGGFDVVKEGEQEKKVINLLPVNSSRTVNRKLIYGVQRVGGTGRSPTKEVNEIEHVQNDNTSCQETEDSSSDVHEKNEEEEEEVDESDKSSGSNHSDERRGSFAFPILGTEWMGSPVKMPKLDDFSPKKQKPIALGFQCCRF